MPQPMALAAETLTGPTWKSRSRSKSPHKTTKAHSRHVFFNKRVLSRLYKVPLLTLHWAIYGAAPFYYLLHYSPFRDKGNGIEAGVLNQFVKWSLCIAIQYITAVIVVSWSGRYRMRKNTSVFVLIVAGLFVFSSIKACVDDDVGISTE